MLLPRPSLEGRQRLPTPTRRPLSGVWGGYALDPISETESKTQATNFCVVRFSLFFPAAGAFVGRAPETAISMLDLADNLSASVHNC
jgi:hypothetical protein